MNEAIISAIAAIVVCVISNHYQRKETEAKHDETIALIEYKLEQLEKKQDLHNNAVERLYKAEQTIVLHEEKLKVANHRIDDLEG